MKKLLLALAVVSSTSQAAYLEPVRWGTYIADNTFIACAKSGDVRRFISASDEASDEGWQRFLDGGHSCFKLTFQTGFNALEEVSPNVYRIQFENGSYAYAADFVIQSQRLRIPK